MYLVDRTETDFSSQEAADMSGVHQALQRDWRRRGILDAKEGSGRVRYTINDVCRLKALGILSQSGISVKTQRAMAWQIGAVTAERVRQMRCAAIVEGIPDELSDQEFARMVETVDGRVMAEHFTLFPLPEPPEGSSVAHAHVGATSLAEALDMARKHAPLAAALMVESLALAREIVAAAPRPLVTYRLTESGAS